MVMTDPIADMLTRIRNANQAKHESVTMPASRLKLEILAVLKNEGYISEYEKKFNTTREAAEWLINNNKVRSNNIRCVRQYLTNNYLKNKPYYGYNISYESKR